jgi:hypothetical protein
MVTAQAPNQVNVCVDAATLVGGLGRTATCVAVLALDTDASVIGRGALIALSNTSIRSNSGEAGP